jgi:membrane-bound serine protease (ClpP class)
MLQAQTPTVVWVGPAGAKAASAGFLILIAADVAAMAPGTRTGAASPVSALFGPNPKDDVGFLKATSDIAAMARTIAEHRGRDVAACERAVKSAEAYTDSQALQEKIIDLVARDRDSLLEALDGREIRRFDGSLVRLETKGATLLPFEKTARQRVLEVLANPVVAYFLLLLGLAGLYVELSHPGLVFPGVVGILSLLLFAYAVQVLSVSVIGLLLILLGIVMFVLEIKVASYGLLTVGGAICLAIGSLMLFQGPLPGMRLPLLVVLPATITLTTLCAVAVRLAVRAQKAPVATGREGLVGEAGIVAEELAPVGKVLVHGEIWNAVSRSGPVGRGVRVRVVGVENMLLTVEPAEGRAAAGG